MLVTNFSPPTLQVVVRSKERNTKEDSITQIVEKDLFFIPFVYNNPSDYRHYVQFRFPFFKSLQYWLVQCLQRSSFKKETDNRRKLLIIRRADVIITIAWLELKYVAILEESIDSRVILKKVNYPTPSQPQVQQHLLYIGSTKQSALVA